MRRATLTAAALALAGLLNAAQAAGPDLDAVISYETHRVLANGVTRVETWQERLVRRGDQVATERVLSAAMLAERDHDHAAGREHDHGGAMPPIGHRHFDAESTTRVVQLGANGAVDLRFVDRKERRVVAVPKTEWSAVGFDGRWDAAAHLVPPSLVASLPVQSRAKDGEWHLQHADGWTHRVLWSGKQQVALRIESKRDDGSASRLVVVKPATPLAASTLPWGEAVAGYRQMVYDDFMD